MKQVYNADLPKLHLKLNWKITLPIVLIVLFFVLCVRTVEAGEVGVITRFGDVNREVQSGLALKLPWPIESIQYMDTRIQKEEQDAKAATSDLQDISATLALNYAVNREKATSLYK